MVFYQKPSEIAPENSGLFEIYYWNLQLLNNVISNKNKVLLPRVYVTLDGFDYPIYALWFYCSQILAIPYMPFGFIAPRFWLSHLGPLVLLLPDFVYPIYALWFYCSQILSIPYMPFGFIAPSCWLSHLFGFIAPTILNYLAFQSFDFEHTWWRLFQKRVVRTRFDICVFIERKILMELHCTSIVIK